MSVHPFDEMLHRVRVRDHYRLLKVQQLHRLELADLDDIPAAAKLADDLIAAEEGFHQGLRKGLGNRKRCRDKCPECRSSTCPGRHYSTPPHLVQGPIQFLENLFG